jgi:streptogrisin C
MNIGKARTLTDRKGTGFARRGVVIGVAALAMAAALGVPAGAQPSGGAAADQSGIVDAAVRAYRSTYPSMTVAAAREAFTQQRTRKSLYERVAGDGATFGGVWFDPPTGLMHVAVTTAAAQSRAVLVGRDLGLNVRTHLVGHTYAELERRAAALRAGTDELGRAARGHVGIDVETNQVTVAVPKDQLPSLATRSAEGPNATADVVRIIADPGIKTQEDAFPCSSRNTCDITIHAGNMLWWGSPGNNQCSVGFTARDSANQRFVYTAGHCYIAGTWGTGNQFIGPMWASAQGGAYDVGIIRVDNPWFADRGISNRGGEIFPFYDVNYVAPTMSYINVGEVTCLSANFTNPAGPTLCGTVGSVSDAAASGMVRVDGVDACNGDSGGGWYWLASPTFRVAYGVHSQSDFGCHGDARGTRSWFSPLPIIQPLWGLTLEVA